MLELNRADSFISNTFMLVRKSILFNGALIMDFKILLRDFIKKKFEDFLVMNECGKFAGDMLVPLLGVVIQDKILQIGLMNFRVVR